MRSPTTPIPTVEKTCKAFGNIDTCTVYSCYVNVNHQDMTRILGTQSSFPACHYSLHPGVHRFVCKRISHVEGLGEESVASQLPSSPLCSAERGATEVHGPGFLGRAMLKQKHRVFNRHQTVIGPLISMSTNASSLIKMATGYQMGSSHVDK